jgi:hypothetical protein
MYFTSQKGVPVTLVIGRDRGGNGAAAARGDVLQLSDRGVTPDFSAVLRPMPANDTNSRLR